MSDFKRGKPERDAAMDRLRQSLGLVKSRISPPQLKTDLEREARKRARAALDSAKKNPGKAAGAAAVAALLLFRKPLFQALRRLIKEKS